MKIINFFILFFIIILIFYILNGICKPKEYYENNNFPKVIYGYWDNLEGNSLIQSHIDTWKRNIPSDWTVHIITKKNIAEYVDEEFIKKFMGLPAFRFSDFLRVHLLSNNGGVWMDASTIITDGSFLDEYYNETVKNNYDATLYEFKVHSLENQPYLENWFLMAPKNSKFIRDLYNEFIYAFDMDFLKYKNEVLKPSINLKNNLHDGNKTYHMQHAIIHYLFYKGNKYNLNIKDAEESMFKIQKLNGWESNKIIDYIINNNNWSNYYAIKLVGFNRKSINDENEKKFINKLNSL